MRGLFVGFAGSMLALLAGPANAQFEPGSFGDAVTKQMCEAGDQSQCPTDKPADTAEPKAPTPPPGLSQILPNSPETAAFGKGCEAASPTQCHYLAKVLDNFIRTYSDRRKSYGCNALSTRQSECDQIDTLSKDVGEMISPATLGYALACDGAINVACLEGARLELSLAQPGSAYRIVNLLSTGCERDDVDSCRELNGLRKRAQLQPDITRLAVGKLCLLAGDAVPCYEFGQALESGIGGPTDWKGAREAFARGCAEPGNHAESCWSYGKSLLSAFMGPVDKPKAREAFLKYCALKKTKRCVAAEEIKL